MVTEKILQMPLKPYFAKNNVQIFCADSTEYAAHIAESGALVIADPPYGINERTYRRSAGRGNLAECNDFPAVVGDDRPFDPRPWLRCERLVLWGANHYANRLPNSPSWLSWDKRNGLGSDDNADCEFAWTNLGGPIRQFHHIWKGAIRASERFDKRVHPTQKPVALMRWLIERCADDDDLIIDPYMGSGTTLLAAAQLGFPAIGFDISPHYCGVAATRLSETLSFSANIPIIKTCPSCRMTYHVILGLTFNNKTRSPDGLQPWCRNCDMQNKRGKHNGWTNFLRTLRNEYPLDVPSWTEEKYLELMGDFICRSCGADVTEWGGGYWVDKISSKRGYNPSNCQPCCWGCNRWKSNRNPESVMPELERMVARYGRGKVPWDEIDPKIKHTLSITPDLTDFIAPTPDAPPSEPDPQGSLFPIDMAAE